jgi:hypothetical protein
MPSISITKNPQAYRETEMYAPFKGKKINRNSLKRKSFVRQRTLKQLSYRCSKTKEDVEKVK